MSSKTGVLIMIKKRFILGTDWYTDCDDAAAVRILGKFQKENKIDLCAIYADTNCKNTAASLYNFARSEGLLCEIGVDYTAQFPESETYQRRLAENCDKTDFEDAVSLCRRLLASGEQTDFIEIGFEQVLERLLRSEPDEISPLTGSELLQNAGSTLWAMAGRWDVENGSEYNICCNDRTKKAADYVSRFWPGDIIYCGFELAEDVIIGKNLPEDDVLKAAFRDYGCENGRSSWDPLTAYIAAAGLSADEFKAVRGKVNIDPVTGENNFFEGDGNRFYLQRLQAPEYYRDILDAVCNG